MQSSFTPAAERVVTHATHLAYARRCLFVGTEHLLLALLSTPCRTSAWLQQELGQGLPSVSERAEKLAASTAECEAASQTHSPSMARSLELAVALQRPAGTEHLLLGALLAASTDGVPNAACTALALGGVDDVRERLLAALGVSAARLAALPARRTAVFGLEWAGPPIPAAAGAPGAAAPAVPVGSFRGPVRGTHWVFPGRVLCGKSAGGMDDATLEALVTAGGVGTFVCLQTQYTEYGCRDYRAALRGLAGRDAAFPPRRLRFLHCPIPDFGVLADESLHALVQELQRLMAGEEGDGALYIHCMGGHGRTGTVVTNLLQAVHGSDPAAALETLRRCHRVRRCAHCSLQHGELEADEQMEQAERMQGPMKRAHMLRAAT